MADLFTALCVVSCVTAGIFSFIVFHFFHDIKKNLWFSLLCFAFSLHLCTGYSIYPYQVSLGAADNGRALYYLISYALVVLCMSAYAGTTIAGNLLRYHVFFNCTVVAIAIMCIIIPTGYVPLFFVIFSIGAILTLLAGVYSCLGEIRSGDKLAYIPAIAVGIYVFFVIADIVFAFAKIKLPSLRCLCFPVLVLCHDVLLTLRYRHSLEKTKDMSKSVQETLEVIQHSDNALMCTQMKADFLYRSLDLISQKCDEDPFTAEDLTISLSKYLRHTLSFQQLTGVVPLSNEIELTKSYIAIERERHPYIQFKYDIPKPLPDFHIPPLSIQPLVENAIEHGLAGKTDGARLTITIMPYKGSLSVDISDNGAGMTDEVAESLTERLHESARVGVFNINARLVDLFGKGLVIQSAPGVGTSISFVIPPHASFEEEEDRNNE